MSAEDVKQMIYNRAVTLEIHPWVDSHPFPAGQEMSPQRMSERAAIKDELRKGFLPDVCHQADLTPRSQRSARNLPCRSSCFKEAMDMSPLTPCVRVKAELRKQIEEKALAKIYEENEKELRAGGL